MRKEKVGQAKLAKFIKAIVIGNFVGIGVCSLFLCLFAFIFLKMETVPQMAIGLTATISATIGAFFAGYISVKISNEKGLLYGTIAGFSLFFIILLVGAAVANEPFNLFTLTKGIIMLFFGAVGGVVGVNKRARAY